MLRQVWKKWEHIEGSQAFLISLLRAAWGLEVNSVCPECLKINEEPADNKKLLGSFLMLMRQKSQWRMPHWTHEPGVVKMQEDVFGPCRQRALETHEKFEPFKKWTATDFLKGYYLVLDNNGGIACTLPLPDGQGGPSSTRWTGPRIITSTTRTSPIRITPSCWRGVAPAWQDCRGTSSSRGSPSPS